MARLMVASKSSTRGSDATSQSANKVIAKQM